MQDKSVYQIFPVITLERLANKLKIAGIALGEGVWKGVFYPASELEKVASGLIGKPLLYEHGMESFGNKPIGEIINSWFVPEIKCILYEAIVKDPEIIKLMDEGTWGVSCATYMNKVTFPDKVVGIDFSFEEMSVTCSPACDYSLITSKVHLSKEYLSTLFKSNKKEEVIKMETKDKEQKTIPKEEVNPQLYAYVELNSEEDLDKLKEFKCSPFYGYPGDQGFQYPYYGYPGQKPMPPAKKSEPVIEEKIAVFKCPVCDKEFPTLEEFQKHWTDVEKEQYGEYKEATSSEYYALKKDILDLKISLGGSIENLTKAKDERILAVKEAKESTKKEILEDFEDVTKRAEAEQSKWNSAGARRLVKECRDTINKHK